jgi:hypothetical protein
LKLKLISQVKCLPWDYLIPPGTGDNNIPPICTTFVGDGYNNSLGAFNSAMEDTNMSRLCLDECLPNCDETTYEYSIDAVPLDIGDLCEHSWKSSYRVSA